MLGLITLLSLLALNAGDEPAKCCTDRQFQAVVGQVGGTVYPLTGNTIFLDGYQEMAYDFYRKRIGTRAHQRLPDGSVKQTSYLQDFANNRQYSYQDGKCLVTTIDQEMTSNCVPDNSTFLGTSTLGFGSESLTVNTWEFVEDGLTMKLGVTATGCVPVLLAYYGMVNGASTDAVEVFSGFKPGIDNPADLDLPSSTAGCVFVDKNSPTSTVSEPLENNNTIQKLLNDTDLRMLPSLAEGVPCFNLTAAVCFTYKVIASCCIPVIFIA